MGNVVGSITDGGPDSVKLTSKNLKKKSKSKHSSKSTAASRIEKGIARSSSNATLNSETCSVNTASQNGESVSSRSGMESYDHFVYCPTPGISNSSVMNDNSGNAHLPNIANYQPPWNSVSFSCGGWLQFYLFGVARAFQATGLDKNVKFAGCSAGALTAAGLALEGDFDAAIDFCKRECLPKAHGHVSGLFRLNEYVSNCVDLLLIKNGKYQDLPDGKLQISISKFPTLGAIRTTKYDSALDLKESLLASAAAYPASPIFKHSKYGLCVDGGLTDFQPVVDTDTITVSPFYFSDCDIRPSRYVPPWWAFIPPKNEDTVDWTYHLGFEDGMAFIKSKGLIPTAYARKHLEDPYGKNLGSHAFDTPRQITVHRFMGYNYGEMQHDIVSFLMDLMLLICFICVLKPFCLFTIYVELVVNVIVRLFQIVVAEMCTIFVPSLVIMFRVFNESNKPVVVAYLEDSLIAFCFDQREDRGMDLKEKLSCIFSLSLLLRFFSSFNRPTSAELRKHDKLYKHSILYRVLRHAV